MCVYEITIEVQSCFSRKINKQVMHFGSGFEIETKKSISIFNSDLDSFHPNPSKLLLLYGSNNGSTYGGLRLGRFFRSAF